MVFADHHVLRFEIAMDDAGFMRRVQSGDELNRDVQNIDQLQVATSEIFAECYAFDVFGGDESSGVSLAEFMYCEDVGMIEVRDCPRFPGKALQSILIFGNFG